MPQPPQSFPNAVAVEAHRLRALAQRLVQSDDADDVAQDALVAALATTQRPHAVRGWLTQVLRNRKHASARQDHRRRAREASAPIPPPEASPEEALAEAQLVAAVNAALLELEPAYRDALRDRFFTDRSAADIARAQGCSASTVRWRVQEGLRRVRRKLDERFDGRSQWLSSMVFIAGVTPPPVHAATPEGSTMTNLTIAKVLAATVLVAGTTAAVVRQDASAQTTDALHSEHPPTASAVAARSPLQFDEADTPPPADPVSASDPAAGDAADCDTCDAPASVEVYTKHHEDWPFLQLPGRCYDWVPELEAGAVVIDLLMSPRGPGEHTVDAVEFAEDRLNAVDGLSDCFADSLREVVLTDLPPDTQRVRWSWRVRTTGGGFGTHDSHSVDADAPDPGTVAKELGVRSRGAEQGAVTVIMCTDHNCGFCNRARATVDELLDSYPEDVVVYELQNPADNERSFAAARAAAAANEQGKLTEMSELLSDNPARRTKDDLVSFATELGLDTRRFAGDLESKEIAASVKRQREACIGHGGAARPSFLVNGDIIIGAQSYETFKALVDDELSG